MRTLRRRFSQYFSARFSWTSPLSDRKVPTGFSENVVVTQTSCQMLQVLSFCDRKKGLNLLQQEITQCVNFSGEKKIR